MSALKIQGVSKNFGELQAVRDLSLTIQEGEVFALLGPNGAGKSTLINMICGLARPSSGKIEVFGYDNITDYQKTRSLLGVTPQELTFDNFFKVGQSLKIHSGYYGQRDNPDWRNFLIDQLALRPHLTKKPIQLSGGMKRRLMIAKSLLHKPRLLILDEPTAGVDVELRRSLWEFVRKINREGVSVLLTTHYIEEAEEMCERVGIMKSGQLIAIDQTRRLMADLSTKQLQVFVAEKLTVLPEALQNLGARLNPSGLAIDFFIGSEVSVDRVLAALQASSIRVIDLVSTEAKLEDIFIQLTGENSNAPN